MTVDKEHACLDPWPPVRGDYTLGDPSSNVAVLTLASDLKVRGAAISGSCKTENLGVEKVVANVISNSNIRYLLVCGVESKGHLPGNSIIALHRHGIDGRGRIIGSAGAIPFIENLSCEAIDRFRRQIEIVDRRGLVDTVEIERLILELRGKAEIFPEEPFEVFKRRRVSRKAAFAGIAGSDVLIGSGVGLNSSFWIVSAESSGPAGDMSSICQVK